MNSTIYTADLLDHQRAADLDHSNTMRLRHAERAADAAPASTTGIRVTVRRVLHRRASARPQRMAHVR